MLRILFLIAFLIPVQHLVAQHKIIINEGESTTNNTSIKVTVFHANAEAMKLCNGLDPDKVDWQPFVKKSILILPDGDGKKVVSVRFKEKSGKITEQFIASVILDTSPPQQLEIQIGDSTSTIHPNRNSLRLRANGASHMKISNDPSFIEERWLPYDSLFVWDFPKGDGEKKIYVIFKDQVGNESEPISASILLDTQAPKNTTLQIVAKHGSRDEVSRVLYTNNKAKTVNLSLQADDALEMMISNVHTFYEAKWQPYQTEVKDWELQQEGADGAHIVYVKFKDKAGNTSKSIKDEIMVDTHPPVDMKFLINDDKPITNSEKVKLTIFARGCDFMKISEDTSFTGVVWEPYGIVKKWNISGEDGLKRVYIIYKDSANNETSAVTATILLDRKKPDNLSMIIEGGTKRIKGASVEVILKAKGANQMQVSLNPSFKGASWVAYSEAPFQQQLTGKRGIRTVYARFRDEARNVSETISSEVILETVPLNGKVVINNDEEFANGNDNIINLSIFATHAEQMMLSNREDFRRATWEKYRTDAIWVLEEGEGEKIVYVKFKSNTETESQVVSDQITVDKSGPYDLGIEINKGAEKTVEQILSVEVKAQDVLLMQLSTSPDFPGVLWENYSPAPQAVRAIDGGGVQRVYVRFRDVAGNITETISDEILYEVFPINNALIINNNKTFCTAKDRKVILQLHSQNATEMIISNKKDLSDSNWEPYNKFKLWDLGGSDGFKRVYAKFRTHTNTESELVDNTIVLDRQAPQYNKMWLSKTLAGVAINPSLLYVSVVSEDAAMMQMSNRPDFSSKFWTWSQYTDLSFIHHIGAQQGEVTVWVRFKDEAGNVSVPISKSIFVDQRPPKDNSIEIKSTSPYINYTDVTLLLHSSDASEMRIGATGHLEHVEWQPYRDSIQWTLRGEDGIKHVYVQFKDATNNISKPVTDNIELDRSGPTTGSISIVDEYCKNPLRLVHLKLATSGATKMMVSNYEDFRDATWQRLKAEIKQWTLLDEDGVRKVYVKFADEADNETRVYSDNILLDRQAPEGNITFNSGAAYTTDPQVTLTMNTGDAIKMMISRRATFDAPAAWEEVSAEKKWKLSEIEGKQTIYMKLLDRAGNVSKVFMDTIFMDTETPIVRSVVINNNMSAVKTGKMVKINSKVLGAKYMMVSNSPDMAGATWEPYFTDKEWTLLPEEGTKTVYLKFKDEYDNETQIFSDSIQTFDKLYRVTK